MIDFNWTILNYTDKWIKVKLGFEKPFSVSKDDMVIVTFPNTSYFVANEKLLIPNLTLNQTLQAVFPDAESARTIRTLGNSVQATMSFTVILILIAQFFLKKLINSVWPFFTTLQLLFLIKLYPQVYLPVNLNEVITKTDSVLKLDALPKKKIQDSILEILKSTEGKITVIGGILAFVTFLFAVYLNCG